MIHLRRIKDAVVDIPAAIDQSLRCARECTEMLFEALRLGGPDAEPEHIAMLANCAKICETSAQFMLSGSPLHVLTCGVCATICEKCAEDCEKREGPYQACIDACLRCAAMCREMSIPAEESFSRAG